MGLIIPDSGIFNFDKMDADVDIKDVINMAADAVDNSTFLKSTSLEDVTNEARAYLAESVDVDPNVIDASLAQMAGNAEKQRAMVVAGKALVQSLAGEVERLAYVIDAGDAGKEVYEKFIRMQARLVETSGNLKATITGAAQATSAGRIRTSDWLTGQELSKADIIKQIDENIAGAGGSTGIDDMARAIILNKASKGGANGIFKIAEGATGPMRVINEVWINAILSGPKTHMINIISNAGNTMLFPAEKMLGGAVSMDPAMIKEGARQYAGIVMAVKDSMKLAGQAFVKGRNLLDPEAAILEANGNDFRAIRSNSDNAAVRGLINGIGEVIRFPSRGLLTADEFFKQVNYRSGVYADLVAQANDLVAAGKLNPKQAGKYIADRMETAVAKDGSARSPRHIERAREVTFTHELGTGDGQFGKLSKEIQNMTNRHPALKLILPFVRTPTNIIKASVQRTPVLRRLSSTLNADLKSGDPKRVAAARGKLVTGNLMWGAAIIAAQEGKITGSGPTDPQQRKLLMETGWRPNSFVIDDGNGGKRYVEYARLEPFSMFLGIAADVTEIGGQVGEQELDDLAVAALIGFTNNVTSKTYLQGLSDTFAALSAPERNLQSLMNRYASSMVPYSSALREARKFKDPALRDVRSMLDAIKNTIPGYSETIPAKRSWITGQIIHYPKGWGADMVSPLGEAFASANPITAGDWKQDPVLDELAGLDFGLSAPTRKIKGVELDQKQYERLLELHGTVRSGLYTMYQRLEKLFESDSYKRLPTEWPAAGFVDTEIRCL
ncbi:hypothetical protein [uncultured Sulfitobacter sp.]|uniref:hypothetical protein n=1 Tax=uncultured Sulfitobacter sp. TaxID=191468 RepID=UPI00260B46D1|nr:hypothetical protein [uncultured Sulfitobacter sp.]